MPSRIPSRLVTSLRSTTAPLHPVRRSLQTTPRRSDKPGITRNERAPPAPKSRATGTQLPVLPLVAIFCFGSLSFYWMVKSRAGQGSSHYVLPERAPPKEQWPRSPHDSR